MTLPVALHIDLNVLTITWTGYDGWIVVIGMLCALCCAVLGNHLLLRRMSMMGDAISHAVLPGLAIAFLLTGQRSSVIMFIGAGLVGILTAALTQWVNRAGRVEHGAAMGVVFTTLFAIGLLLIVRAAHYVDLDPSCVLYGSIELAPLDTWRIIGLDIPRAAVILAGLFMVNVLLVLLFWKELKISAFDAGLATTLGINSTAMNYLLMTFIAITTVASFEVVGSILVIAMLIVPPATAHLLTDRLGAMVLVSLLVAAACAPLGHVGAIVLPPALGFAGGVSTSGLMAVASGVLFSAALLFAPRHGLVSKLWYRGGLRMRICAEDALGLLYRLEERRDDAEALVAIDAARLHATLNIPSPLAKLVLRTLTRKGALEREPTGYGLTPTGRRLAASIVRNHRLWETYLHDRARIPAQRVHDTAHRFEHITSSAMQRRLDEEAQQPERDPHGSRIPPAS